MPGLSFTTVGDGKPHKLSERLGTIASDAPRVRAVIRNDAYNNAGTSVISGSGPLAVGVDDTQTCVLVTPQTTAIDSITIHQVVLGNIWYNDFGKACQLSVTWNPEPVFITQVVGKIETE